MERDTRTTNAFDGMNRHEVEHARDEARETLDARRMRAPHIVRAAPSDTFSVLFAAGAGASSGTYM